MCEIIVCTKLFTLIENVIYNCPPMKYEHFKVNVVSLSDTYQTQTLILTRHLSIRIRYIEIISNSKEKNFMSELCLRSKSHIDNVSRLYPLSKKS